jgi:hypothetical protein
VTIAQAIDESAWGKSQLAADYHNLFGIKGTGPAGSVDLPTSEFYNGQWVNIDAPFRVYHNVAESIADHAELLATSGYYQRAMADRGIPDAFANDLTGVYATDPDYGSTIIAIMKLYNLYRFDSPSTASPSTASPASPSPASASAQPSAAAATPTTSGVAATPQSAASPPPAATPQPTLGQAAPTVHAASSAPAPASQAAAASQAQIPGLATPALAPTPTATASGANTQVSVPPGATRADIPGLAMQNTPGQNSPGQTAASANPAQGDASIPGLAATTATNVHAANAHAANAHAANAQTANVQAANLQAANAQAANAQAANVQTASFQTASFRRQPATTAPRYQPQLPHAMTTAYFATAKGPLAHGEHLYRDVAAQIGLSWKLLAACDWMQCKAHPRYSPVRGEKIGALNPDGTSYSTKSAALAQCASDLIELAAAVYGIDLTARRPLSVRALADAFAAFRWGALLRRHRVSAMEFPYAVAGLTEQHLKMHWPVIDDPAAPDRPGAKFREPFGAVPVVLSLDYPATVLADRKRR